MKALWETIQILVLAPLALGMVIVDSAPKVVATLILIYYVAGFKVTICESNIEGKTEELCLERR